MQKQCCKWRCVLRLTLPPSHRDTDKGPAPAVKVVVVEQVLATITTTTTTTTTTHHHNSSSSSSRDHPDRAGEVQIGKQTAPKGTSGAAGRTVMTRHPLTPATQGTRWARPTRPTLGQQPSPPPAPQDPPDMGMVRAGATTTGLKVSITASEWVLPLCCAVLCCAVLCCAVLCCPAPHSLTTSPPAAALVWGSSHSVCWIT